MLAGYYLVECADLDAAIEVAAGLPGARSGAIEVRPVIRRRRAINSGIAGRLSSR